MLAKKPRTNTSALDLALSRIPFLRAVFLASFFNSALLLFTSSTLNVVNRLVPSLYILKLSSSISVLKILNSGKRTVMICVSSFRSVYKELHADRETGC